jgi:hypothetical protein
MNRIILYRTCEFESDELTMCRLFLKINNIRFEEDINLRLCMILSKGKVNPSCGFVIDIFDSYVYNFNRLFILIERRGLLLW